MLIEHNLCVNYSSLVLKALSYNNNSVYQSWSPARYEKTGFTIHIIVTLNKAHEIGVK